MSDNTYVKESVIEEEIPHANEVEDLPKMTEEELEDKERLRCGYIEDCRDYVLKFIKSKAKGKINYRANSLKNNACIFRYSPPAKRGERTRYYSQVWYNVEKEEYGFDYERPPSHPKEIWYFPIWYMMNGFTKNPKRTFQAIGLVPVETFLRNLFESRGYTIKYYRNRHLDDRTETGNLVVVEWGSNEKKEENN